jgi:hypothetical protein
MPEPQPTLNEISAKVDADMAARRLAWAQEDAAPKVVDGPHGPRIVPGRVAGVKAGSTVEPGQLADAEDYPEGGEPDSFLPFCDFPNCRNRARLQFGMFNRRGLLINAKGQLVRGEFVPLHEETVTTIGPRALQGQVQAARLAPKPHLDLCSEHFRWDWDYAPEAPRKVYTSGPYSALSVERRARLVERMTGARPRVFERKEDGVTKYFINGDSKDVPGWKGKMTPGNLVTEGA